MSETNNGKEQEPAIKVTDRRRFSPDGSPKEEASAVSTEPEAVAAAGEDAPEATAEAPAVSTKPEAVAAAGDGAPEATPDAPAAQEAEGAEPAGTSGASPEAEDAFPGPLPKMDFSTFCMSLYSAGMVHLGQVCQPGETEPQKPSLVVAQQHIDILAMLKEKTAGNLSPDEGRLLDAFLYELRMVYVDVQRCCSELTEEQDG